MLGPILAPAQCWNWDRFFVQCWNWDTDVPVLAPCHYGASHAGTGLKNEILLCPVLELDLVMELDRELATQNWHRPHTSISANMGCPILAHHCLITVYAILAPHTMTENTEHGGIPTGRISLRRCHHSIASLYP